MTKLDSLWPLWKRDDLPAHHRAVLMMTFDTAYVERLHYARAAKDIRHFLSDFPPTPNYVNHWPHLAVLYENGPRPPAIGIYHTSVSENPFARPRSGRRDWSKFYSIYPAIAAGAMATAPAA